MFISIQSHIRQMSEWMYTKSVVILREMPSWPQIGGHYSAKRSHDPVVCPRDHCVKLPGKFKFIPRFPMDVIEQSLDNSDDRDEDDPHIIKKEDIQVITSQSLTIVEDDASLGSSEDQAAVAGLTHSMLDGEDEVQYFRSGDGGTLTTYRVVQVGDSDQLPQMSSPPYSPNSSSVPQAVLATTPINGQFYVIGSPQEVFGTSQVQRSLAPRLSSSLHGGPTAVRRDDKRRATHNEVERRRRDKINTWIMELSKIVPDCVPETTKSPGQSKGGILAKAFKYIMELRTQNSRLADGHKQTETLAHKVKQLQRELEAVQRKNVNLQQEVSLLRSQLNLEQKTIDT